MGLFGRKRRNVESPETPPRDIEPTRQTNEEARAFNERCGANLEEVAALEASGRKALAELTDVVLIDRMESLGQREFDVTAEVRPVDGDPFTTRFSIFDTTHGLYTPHLGQTIAVVHDDADPPMVRASIFWDKPDLALYEADSGPVLAVRRWKVPTECPICGAPVDQSRQSQAAHPACEMCRAPLPCEPASA